MELKMILGYFFNLSEFNTMNIIKNLDGNFQLSDSYKIFFQTTPIIDLSSKEMNKKIVQIFLQKPLKFDYSFGYQSEVQYL